MKEKGKNHSFMTKGYFANNFPVFSFRLPSAFYKSVFQRIMPITAVKQRRETARVDIEIPDLLAGCQAGWYGRTTSLETVQSALEDTVQPKGLVLGGIGSKAGRKYSDRLKYC